MAQDLRTTLLRFYLTIILIISLPYEAYADYSEPYDNAIEDTSLVDPQKAMQMAETALLEAQASDNAEKQLVAMYYVVTSCIILLDYEKAKTYIDKGLLLANNKKNVRFQSEFWGFKSFMQDANGDYQSAIVNANKAIKLAKQIEDDRLLGIQMARRAEVYLSLNDFESSLQDVQNAIEIFKEHNDPHYLSAHYNLLAIIYESSGDYDTAITYYNESLNYIEQKSIHITIPTYHNIAYAYLQKKDYSMALEFFHKARSLAKEQDNVTALARIDYGIAEVNFAQEKVEQAEQLMLRVLEVLEKNNDGVMLFNSYSLLADINILKQQFESAEKYLNLAEQQTQQFNTTDILLSLLNSKVKFYVAQEMWYEAYLIKEQIEQKEIEIRKVEKQRMTDELKVQFDVQFDKDKLDLLQKQNELQQKSIIQEKSKKKYLLGLLVLGFFCLTIMYYAYWQQRKNRKHLYHLSNTDHLTGTANRRKAMKTLKNLFNVAESSGAGFSLVMIDLDFFKKINDGYGHDVGNQVLKYFASCAQSTMGESGEVARLGGEEWLIVVNITDQSKIKQYLHQLRALYKTANDPELPKGLDLSFSSGVLAYSDHYKHYDHMLRDVDKAMYNAKQNGRNQDVFFDS